MLIENIVKYNQNDAVVSPSRLIELALKFQDKNLFEQYLAKGLESCISENSTSYGYQVGSNDQKMDEKRQIRAFMDKYKVREYK